MIPAPGTRRSTLLIAECSFLASSESPMKAPPLLRARSRS
jgi:hypothetical protein